MNLGVQILILKVVYTPIASTCQVNIPYILKERKEDGRWREKDKEEGNKEVRKEAGREGGRKEGKENEGKILPLTSWLIDLISCMFESFLKQGFF